MKIIRLTTCLPDEEVDKLGGTHLPENCYDHLLQEDAEVYKPDGTLLLKFRKGILPLDLCQRSYESVRSAATPNENRGMAGGILTEEKAKELGMVKTGGTSGRGKGVRAKRINSDGTISNTSVAIPVLSGVMGSMDRNARFPYCRTTAWNNANPEKFAKAMPLIQRISDVFKNEVPDRWKAQKDRCDKTAEEWVIPNTVFTTITVNKNWQTAVHKDQGDLAEGFGVMSAFSAGGYKGCYLVFPKYRVAADMRTGDVILCDVHEWHGNTPLVPQEGKPHERISCVFYYRENMLKCGTAKEELDNVKKRVRGAGQPVYA